MAARRGPALCFDERYRPEIAACGIRRSLPVQSLSFRLRAVVLGDRIFSEYNGALVENMAASELARKSDGALFYWTSENVAEVDFLVSQDEAILPLEVKSGLNRNIKSLRVYASKYNPVRIYRASPRNFEHSGDFANIPLYAIGLFPELR
jgi:predicted AAA+ superfamily ATPase